MPRAVAFCRRLVVAVLLLLAPAVTGAQSPAPNVKPAAPKLDVEFEPTPQHIVEAMLKLAKVTAADVVTDLGCGEGRIPITAVKQFGAKGIGVDLDPQRIREANANADKQGVAGRVTFIEGDLYKADISASTVVTLFLWPSINLKLRPRLLELAPGTRIVSHGHDMGDWPADRSEWYKTADGPSAVYLWIIPAKLAGTWDLVTDEGSFEVKITQKYQHFFGSGRAGNKPVSIINGRIVGNALRFEAVLPSGRRARFAGRLADPQSIASEHDEDEPFAEYRIDLGKAVAARKQTFAKMDFSMRRRAP